MENKLKKILVDVLQVDIEEVNEETSANTVDNWDSLNQMKLIVAIEEQFDIEFDDEEIVLLNSYSKIMESLKSKTKRQ